MPKLLIISVVLAMIVIPVVASADRSPVRGLRRAVAYTLGFNLAYYLALRYVLPRLY